MSTEVHYTTKRGPYTVTVVIHRGTGLPIRCMRSPDGKTRWTMMWEKSAALPNPPTDCARYCANAVASWRE
jgi:hypothetical protein